MRKYKVAVVDEDNDRLIFTEAWTGGQMASGELTWEFEGMEDGAIYTASRMWNKETGKAQYVLFRQ